MVETAFGHGLSYTSFAWSDIKLSGRPADDDDVVCINVTITNTGRRTGRDVVQVYVLSPDDGPPSLEGFAKTRPLAPGESETLHVELRRRAFAHWDQDEYSWVMAAGVHDVRVARSAVDVVASLHVEVEKRRAWGPGDNF